MGMIGGEIRRADIKTQAVARLYLTVRRQVLADRLEASIRAAWHTIPRSCRPTAVVAWNDAAAQVCMKLLVEDGRRVPRDVSIVSFDDCDIASAVGISSYNFNEFRTMCEMLDWVTWPRRREQNRVDDDPQTGGSLMILVEDVHEFEMEYLDAATGEWTDTWDTREVTHQPNRLPVQVKITLTVEDEDARGDRRTYVTRAQPMITWALNHAVYNSN